jgi:hypothetical protein
MPFASITSAFQQHQQQRREQRPRPVGLFSVAKAEAAADPRRVRHDFRIVKIAPDGKCMFRALASGMSFNAGYYIVGSEEEEADADALRMAVADALCRSAERRGQFKEAMFELETEDTLGGYCQRLQQPTFWGGNVEMQVLSKMLKVPITVYNSVTEQGGRGGGFTALGRYGDEYSEDRDEVALLHTGGNHFDLLTK